MSKPLPPPHPRIVATREALAKRHKPSLEQVLVQAEASRKYKQSGSRNSPKPQGT